MKKRYQNIFVSILLYAIIFMFGLFVIYAFQYHYHSDLSQSVYELANEPTQLESIFNGRLDYRGLLFFQGNDSETLSLYYNEDTTLDYQDFVSDYIKTHDFSQTNYRLATRIYPLDFYAIAAAPVYENEQIVGTLYSAHVVSYLPSIIHTFMLFYSIVFCLFIMHLYFIHMFNDKVTNIYRKYVANISHELKSPVAAIHAITETLTAGLVEDEETLHKYYNIIDRESHRLEQSVLDIIELSKIQEHRVNTSKVMTPASEILYPIHKRYFDFCDDIGIRFKIEDSAIKLPDLYTNADRIIQLMQILIDNAVKFTAEGGEVTISAEYDDKKAILKIHDTGCGMDEETISHIFERFYRGTNTNEYAGSGLGLSIAKELTRALDEKIWAASELNVGTDFYFTISRKKSYFKLKL